MPNALFWSVRSAPVRNRRSWKPACSCTYRPSVLTAVGCCCDALRVDAADDRRGTRRKRRPVRVGEVALEVRVVGAEARLHVEPRARVPRRRCWRPSPRSCGSCSGCRSRAPACAVALCGGHSLRRQSWKKSTAARSMPTVASFCIQANGRQLPVALPVKRCTSEFWRHLHDVARRHWRESCSGDAVGLNGSLSRPHGCHAARAPLVAVVLHADVVERDDADRSPAGCGCRASRSRS